MSGPKRGFTLIELLVVIAIIAILAAILFPVFAKARAKAYQTTCVNNQRQLAVAIQMYVQDNDESFPLPGDWVSAVNMAKDPKIFDCPSSTSAGSPSKPDYGMNAVLYENINGVKSQLALGSIENPEMTELTSDMAYMTGATITVDNPFANAAVVNSFYGSNAEARHTNAFVVSYVDGHVASVKQAKDMGLSFFSLPTAAGRVFVDFSKLTAATAPAAAASIFSTNGASEQGYLPAAPNAPVGSFNSLSKTWDINGALTQSAWTGNTTASIIYTAKTATPMGYSLIVQGDCGSGTRVRLSNCNPRIASNAALARDWTIANCVDYNRITNKVLFGDKMAYVPVAGAADSWCEITPYATPGQAALIGYSSEKDIPSSTVDTVTLTSSGFTNGPPNFAQWNTSMYILWPGATELNATDYAYWSSQSLYVASFLRQFVYTRVGLEHFGKYDATVRASTSNFQAQGSNQFVSCRSSLGGSPAVHVMGGTFKIRKAVFCP